MAVSRLCISMNENESNQCLSRLVFRIQMAAMSLALLQQCKMEEELLESTEMVKLACISKGYLEAMETLSLEALWYS